MSEENENKEETPTELQEGEFEIEVPQDEEQSNEESGNEESNTEDQTEDTSTESPVFDDSNESAVFDVKAPADTKPPAETAPDISKQIQDAVSEAVKPLLDTTQKQQKLAEIESRRSDLFDKGNKVKSVLEALKKNPTDNASAIAIQEAELKDLSAQYANLNEEEAKVKKGESTEDTTSTDTDTTQFKGDRAKAQAMYDNWMKVNAGWYNQDSHFRESQEADAYGAFLLKKGITLDNPEFYTKLNEHLRKQFKGKGNKRSGNTQHESPAVETGKNQNPVTTTTTTKTTKQKVKIPDWWVKKRIATYGSWEKVPAHEKATAAKHFAKKEKKK